MNGIATGAGVGVIRGISASLPVACNWAVGSFILVACGTWKLCQNRLDEERRKVQKIVEAMPKRTLKKLDDGNTQQASTT
jgi:cytochrome c oxidase assembly protein subunit 20